jgi:hypothetical protein
MKVTGEYIDEDNSNLESMVPSGLWSQLPDDIQQEIDACIPPQGFNKELWDNLESSTRYTIKNILYTKKNPNEKRKTHFIRFFTDSKFYIGTRLEEAFNYMALILALLLTIPYGVLSTFDSNYFASIKEYLQDNCEEKLKSYRYIRISSIENCWLTIYASMCGLLMVVIYYVFKPSNLYELRLFTLIKGRILLACIGICTTVSIVGVMDSAANLIQWYNVPYNESLCQDEPSYYKSLLICGLISIAFAVLIPIVLLNTTLI